MYLLIPTALLQTHTAPAHHRRPAPGLKLNNSRAVSLLMNTGHTFTAAAGTAHHLQQAQRHRSTGHSSSPGRRLVSMLHILLLNEITALNQLWRN